MTGRVVRFSLGLAVLTAGMVTETIARDRAEHTIKASGATEVREYVDGVSVIVKLRTQLLSPEASKKTDQLPGLVCTGGGGGEFLVAFLTEWISKFKAKKSLCQKLHLSAFQTLCRSRCSATTRSTFCASRAVTHQRHTLSS